MPLHVQTPTIRSTEFSNRTGIEVFLKLECTQPSGSFKLRGVGHACETWHAKGAKRFVSSSGGNAGYAVAYAGNRLGMPVTVVVPETTSDKAKAMIRSENAEVIVHGKSWKEANELAQSLLDADTQFIHPFDDPLLWQGHASMIDELAQQIDKPDVVVCSVGGGGLLAGVCEGLVRNAWTDVGVMAVETEGAASYDAAIRANGLVEIASIQSIATSLGARQVCERAMQVRDQLAIKNLVLSDAQAVQGSVDLLEVHRLVTEPACGVSVAALERLSAIFPDARRVAVIVCGGVGATAAQLAQWQAR